MRRVVSAIALSALSLAALGGCGKPAVPADLKADIEAIMAVETELRAAYQEKDAARFAALFAEDATLYIPGEQRPRVGRDAIGQAAQKDFADPAFSITQTTGKVGAFAPGDAGYAKGSFTIRYTDPATGAATGYSGYYLTLFGKDEDGHWKVIEDMATPAG